MEAIASEVALLRRQFPSSIAWGLSDRHWALMSWKRGFCLNPRLHLAFRAATSLLEPMFDVNHVFGTIGDWFYLRGQRKRPTIVTAAAVADPVETTLLDQVDCFVAEHPAGRTELQECGIDDDRIRLIMPPVDLQRFSPDTSPPDHFTVLFASSPDNHARLEGRGVRLLVEAARQCPDIKFRLLWRPWGDSLATVEKWIDEFELNNIEIKVGVVQDMAEEYRAAHMTIAPFTQPELCKPAPNSLIESLSSGRPVLCTDRVGMAQLVQESDAGACCSIEVTDVVAGLKRIQSDWKQLSKRARELAEERFDERKFIASYEHIYRELTA